MVLRALKNSLVVLGESGGVKDPTQDLSCVGVCSTSSTISQALRMFIMEQKYQSIRRQHYLSCPGDTVSELFSLC